ncbi:Hypothetical predicted protein [Pelobates cultripes]|uniref:Uncharacterized protein n=1 Tax=Pelobates cultripes TaxID=61616 RepID=A0AAD1W543_PELCU|nr:Hypothetical predicted protein [Pelobates cultripes]
MDLPGLTARWEILLPHQVPVLLAATTHQELLLYPVMEEHGLTNEPGAGVGLYLSPVSQCRSIGASTCHIGPTVGNHLKAC